MRFASCCKGDGATCTGWCRLRITVPFRLHSVLPVQLYRPSLLACLLAAVCGVAQPASGQHSIVKQGKHQAPGAATSRSATTSAATTSAATTGAATTGAATSGAVTPALQKPLLPPAFAGEPREGDIVIDPTATTIDSAHAAALKEDGVVQASQARYRATSGPGWTVEAMRFQDVTGAYAAFSFYRTAQMEPETVGDEAAAGPGVFVARRGATVVIARCSAATPPSGAALVPAMRVLVNGLPRIYGPESIPPMVPDLLPRAGLQKRSIRYALGPAGYSGPLPSGILGFQADAEVASGIYRLPGGKQATLTLSMLPTPQLAHEMMRDVAAMPDATIHIASRQYGSLVAVVTGAGLSPAQGRALLDKVHYAPQVTMAEPVQGGGSSASRNPVAQVAQLLVTVAEFTIVMAVSAVALAGFFGFGRVYIRRLRGKPDSSLYDDEFITLKLK
jgi:hypothetical protein